MSRMIRRIDWKYDLLQGRERRCLKQYIERFRRTANCDAIRIDGAQVWPRGSGIALLGSMKPYIFDFLRTFTFAAENALSSVNA